MVAIPYLSQIISVALGPYFEAMGSDVSIAALSIIAVDMGGYQLADALAANRDMWITAMIVGYTSGATIVYLIPVGLMMLDRKDHKYLALGAMAGLISIPFAVLAALTIITAFNLPVRDIVSTSSPALHHLTLDFLGCVKLLTPLFIFCFVLAAGLRYRPSFMVAGFLVFGKLMDAFIKIVLALAIVEHFTGFFMKNFGVWGFDPMFADQKELFRAIEIAGYIGIMLAGTFPICYLFQRYCKKPMVVLGKLLGLSSDGAAAFVLPANPNHADPYRQALRRAAGCLNCYQNFCPCGPTFRTRGIDESRSKNSRGQSGRPRSISIFVTGRLFGPSIYLR